MHDTPGTQGAELKRSLSLALITCYGLGTIIGAGIYVLIGEIAARAGMHAPLAFAFAAVVAAFTAFSYAELCARYPHSAGEAAYVQAAFGRVNLSTFTGSCVILVGIVSAATLANGFVGYLRVFITLPDQLVIIGFILALAALAAWGISESVWAATLITLLELFGLGLVLFVTSGSFMELPERWPELLPRADGEVWTGVFLGAFLAFYAFIGFEDMVNVAEEVKNPRRNLPRAIVLALTISTLLYVLVALAAVLALPIETLAHSGAPLALIVEQRGGLSPAGISLISLAAVSNGALIQIIMASRVVYGMSRQGLAPSALGAVNSRTRTPLVATVAVTAVALAFALWLPLVRLAQLTSLVTLIVFALINLALLRLKRAAPHPQGIVRYPLWVPVIGFTLCIGLIVLQFV